jgi:hypothetical protein
MTELQRWSQFQDFLPFKEVLVPLLRLLGRVDTNANINVLPQIAVINCCVVMQSVLPVPVGFTNFKRIIP